MKNCYLFCILLFILTSACSTTNSYIRQNQALFDSYSPSDQRLIKSGQIAVGFTEMQVRMAIGAPSRIVPDTRPNSTRYIWEYVDFRHPRAPSENSTLWAHPWPVEPIPILTCAAVP